MKIALHFFDKFIGYLLLIKKKKKISAVILTKVWISNAVNKTQL